MKIIQRIVCVASIFVLAVSGFSQSLDDPQKFPEVRIYISKEQQTRLSLVDGTKLELRHPILLINDDSMSVKDIHSRGRSSLNFARKSLSVDLKHPATFHLEGKKLKIKKFDLLNLEMDKNLWHDRWAFMNLAELNMFPLLNTYCKLWINDTPQGIYLLVEKPNDLGTQLKIPYMIRRGSDHSITQEYVYTTSKEEGRKYKDQYLGMYRGLSKNKNESLQQHLQSALDLDHYFTWLAFNYLIMNGDYTDEVFFYIHPESGVFDIIAWDYDDMFKRTPHEGAEARNAKLNDKMIFSLEDALDRSIAADELLYGQYCASFRKLLLTTNPTSIERTLGIVLRELEILMEDQAMAKASTFMGKDSFNIDKAKEDIRIMGEFLVTRRKSILVRLDK